MKIHGHVTCFDKSDLCTVTTAEGQSANIACTDSTDQFESSGYVINNTSWSSDGTFIQGQYLTDSTGLTKTFLSRRYQGWTYTDGTYVDGTYTEPFLFDPVRVSYGIYHQYDGTHWQLQGYRYRTPMNPSTGFYYANMNAPQTLGAHRIEWMYRKDSSSYSTVDNQTFGVINWGNSHYTGSLIPYGSTFFIQAVPANLIKNPGETAAFTLIITGTVPAPLFYQWRKNGVNLTNTGKFSGINTDTLVISSVTINESSSYDCVVSALAVSTPAWLVIDPP